ncbi:MAG: hypothetical protein Fur0010_25100 [Bdellovibrio sp.]
MREKVLRNYFRLYDFVSKNRREARDLDERHIHTHLVIVLTTGILMWAYAVVAHLTIDHIVPAIVGYVASAVHLFSPLLFRINKNAYFNANVLIGSGLVHQSTFSYFTGGFTSNIIIWFGILPMLGGVIAGRKGVKLWAFITTAVTATYLGLYINGFNFPNLITHTGFLIVQALLSFGWIFLSGIIIWVYVLLNERNEQILEEKNLNIQNLIHILCHDICNPLSITKMRLDLLNKRKEISPEDKTSLEKALNGVHNISEIVENVRQMYALEHGKLKMGLEKVCVFSLWSHLNSVFEDKLKQKSLTLDYDGPRDSELFVWANDSGLRHQVLSNVLSNAIKFSPQGSRIKFSVKENANGTVSISIKDQGIGIPAELKDKIFDIKSMTTREGTNGEIGTGFGMPIVKTYVDKIGGKIFVETNTKDQGEDHGTCVTIEIRRAT